MSPTGLLAASLRAVAAATTGSTALLGGGIVAGLGRSVTRATPDFSALTRAAAGMAIEAMGGQPARHNSSNGPRAGIAFVQTARVAG